MSAFFFKRNVPILVLLCILAFTRSFSAAPVVLAKTTDGALLKKIGNSNHTMDVLPDGTDAVSSILIRFDGIVKSVRRGVVILDTSANAALSPEFILASSTTIYLATSTSQLNNFPFSRLVKQATTTPFRQHIVAPEKKQMDTTLMRRVPIAVGDSVRISGRLTYDGTVVDGVVVKNNSKHGLSHAH